MVTERKLKKLKKDKETYAGQEIEELSDIAHILLRPSVYIGGVEYTTKNGFFLNNNGMIEYKEYESVGGLIKIINEIIDNSIDEGIKTNFDFSNEIHIDINKNSISVKDNGRGIPVVKKGKNWGPEIAFTRPRAGSNFKDDDRSTIGLNGLGAFLTNCYSNLFKVETCDGKKKLTLICKNNMSDYTVKTTTGHKRGTTVYFEPDLSRFPISEIDTHHINIIKERLIHMATTYPNMKIIFNGKQIRSKMSKTYLQCFSPTFEFIEGDDYIIGVMPNKSDDFRFSSHVNGLNIVNGGNNIDLYVNEIVSRIRSHYMKRYPNIKPGDIKNKIQIVSLFRNFKKAQFDGQTKEKLTNSVNDIRTFLGTIDWDTFVDKIIKNTDMIEPIIETYKIKEEFKARKAVEDENNGLLKKKIRLEKFFPSSGKNKYLFLCEGDSAVGGILPILGRKEIAYFAMKGKPMNAYESMENKILGNKEYKSIIQILRLNITEEITDCNFNYIVLANDQDVDGIHIQGLMIGFFNRIAPKLIESGRLLRFRTPLITFTNSKGKIVNHFFNVSDYEAHIATQSVRGLNIKFYKGLGTWVPNDLKALIKEFGFDYFLERFEYGKTSDELIHNWLSKKNKMSDMRKEYIKQTKLDMSKV